MSIMVKTTARKDCYTCTSKKRQNHPVFNMSRVQSCQNGQILLNTAKILKGNKKNLKQHLRNQSLKSRCSNSTNKTKPNSYFNSIARTSDTTPRQMTNQNFQLRTFSNQKYNETLTQIRKDSSHVKDKIKMITQAYCKKQLKRINNQSKKKQKNSKLILKQEIDNLIFRDRAFSKQLVNYHQDNKKPAIFKSLNSKVITTQYQSANLQKRMNQYMNVLIQKSQKDQLDIMQTILSQKHAEQSNKLRDRELKIMEKLRQKNVVFCKKLKVVNRSRNLRKNINANCIRESISPKYRSIDMSWRDIVQENKDSQLTKNIFKMHNSNQFNLQKSHLYPSHNSFLKALICKKRFDLQ